MDETTLAKIEISPRYQELIRRRTRLGAMLTALVLLAYFGFIATIAFDKPLLAAPIGSGVTSVGIPVGFGLILFAILLTGFYTWRANREFDRLTRAILEEVAA